MPSSFGERPEHGPRLASTAALSLADAAICLDTVNALVAVIGPDDAIVWANRRWSDATGIAPDAAVGSRLQDYYTGARLREHESLLRRVRETNRGVRFRDMWRTRSVQTTIRPLGQGRLLVLSDILGAPIEGGAADGHVDHIELTHTSWGPLDKLSKREREVLGLLGSGLTIKEIAELLARSEKTIEGHRDSIYRKLGVNSRAELAILGIQVGLMPLTLPKPQEPKVG